MKYFWRGSRLRLPFLVFALGLQPLAFTVTARGDDAAAAATFLKLDEQGRVLVDVGIRGQGPYPFLLDTAASRTVVYRTLVSLLEIEAIPRRSRRVMTATGAREMQLYRLGVLTALSAEFDIGETVAMPDPPVNGLFGILGVDVMQGRQLDIDKTGVRLLDAGLDGLPEGTDWLQISGRPVGYGSVAVTVRIGGLEIPAIVDTGAGASVLNPKAAEALGLDLSDSVGVETATLSAAGGTMAARLVTVPDMAVGDWKHEDQKLVVARLPVFTTYGATHAPAMVLGADVLLKAHRLVIDFKDWSLYIQRP